MYLLFKSFYILNTTFIFNVLSALNEKHIFNVNR